MKDWIVSRKKSQSGQGAVETAVGVLVLCVAMFSFMMLCMMCYGIISGYDAAFAAVRAAATWNGGAWGATTVENAVKASHVLPLMAITQPNSNFTVEGVDMNDSNNTNAYWRSAFDTNAEEFARPRDRQGWLSRMKIAPPGGDAPATLPATERIRNIDIRTRFRMPYLFTVIEPNFAIVTDMQAVRSKDRGSITGNNHLTMAYPGAGPW